MAWRFDVIMIGGVPKFYDSPYFVDEPGNWHLKPGAPEDVRKEFEAYMKADSFIEEVDIEIVDEA
ncbi:MAG: hypothetical protein IIV02_06030 [Peptococcaceae bacterium]|nr:hypothetical protein [Peptococcaceae bacterium]